MVPRLVQYLARFVECTSTGAKAAISGNEVRCVKRARSDKKKKSTFMINE